MSYGIGYSDIWGSQDPQGDQIDRDIMEAYGAGDTLLAEYLNTKYNRKVEAPVASTEDHLFSPTSTLTSKNNPIRRKAQAFDEERTDLENRIRRLEQLYKVCLTDL